MSKSQSQSSTNQNNQLEDGKTIIAQWMFEASGRLPQSEGYFVLPKDSTNNAELDLIILEDAKEKKLAGEGLTLQNFTAEMPERISIDSSMGDYFTLFFNEQEGEILSVAVSESEIEIAWIVQLAQPISTVEFKQLTVIDVAGKKTIKIGSNLISDLTSDEPSVEIYTATPSCNANQHLENNVCVANNRACAIPNGTGTQTWMQGSWGSCMIASCNSGYQSNGTSCMPVAADCVDSNEVACTTSSTQCSERIKIGDSTNQVWRNYSLTKNHCKITHMIIMVHGRSRNPEDYFSYTTSATKTEGRMADTLVVAPAFRQHDDSKVSTDLYWNRDLGSNAFYDWAQGGSSAGPEKISSFAVLDSIISQVVESGRFPNLKSIVVAGHSAGGQTAHRYALSGNVNNQGLPQTFYYVPANPSSYAYLDERRPLDKSLTNFGIPKNCSGYNKWGYGLENRNPYVNRSTEQELITQYRSRNVAYLLGEADNDPNDDSMDLTCSANAQGQHRLDRGKAYFNFIQKYYPTNTHSIVTVPGIAHEGSRLIQSVKGRAVLFPKSN